MSSTPTPPQAPPQNVAGLRVWKPSDEAREKLRKAANHAETILVKKNAESPSAQALKALVTAVWEALA